MNKQNCCLVNQQEKSHVLCWQGHPILCEPESGWASFDSCFELVHAYIKLENIELENLKSHRILKHEFRVKFRQVKVSGLCNCQHEFTPQYGHIFRLIICNRHYRLTLVSGRQEFDKSSHMQGYHSKRASSCLIPYRSWHALAEAAAVAAGRRARARRLRKPGAGIVPTYYQG